MSVTEKPTRIGLAGIFLWIIFGSIGLLILSYIYAESKKEYWDQQVKALCEKDGGVTVYQHVKVTPEEYEKYGGRHGAITVPPSTFSGQEEYPYFYTLEKQIIREKDPEVFRSLATVYRRSDGEIIGATVNYFRDGGNFAFFRAPGYSCRDLGIRIDVMDQIFIIPGEK
jgi:hypothetical protein